MKHLSFIALVIFTLFIPLRLDAAEFRYGLDVLDSDGFRMLAGKRVGLIANAASVGTSGEPGYRLMLRHGIRLKFLMAPEHGFSIDREAGQMVGDTSVTGSFPVYSLYGASKKPDPLLLISIDVLIFDLQDVGTRCYTYISTMRLAMEACREAGIPFVVLDRPNPIAPVPASGFVLEPSEESFVGVAGLPFLHGMTAGEIARWLQKSRYPELSLNVVAMQGYNRHVFADQLSGFRFIAPSPNIRDLETALIYPATVLLEATDVSEGRGTDDPFRMFGAPFVDGVVLKGALDRYRLPGVEFQPALFTPASSKFTGRRCQGVRIRITDRNSFDPFRTSVAILLSLQKLYPGELGLGRHAPFFDQLAGTSRYRTMVMKQRPIGEIVEAARRSVQPFDADSSDRFLYH
jgi:uncharacterized protein YbbC (DUF1343 family)